MPPQDGAPDKDTNLGSMQRMVYNRETSWVEQEQIATIVTIAVVMSRARARALVAGRRQESEGYHGEEDDWLWSLLGMWLQQHWSLAEDKGETSLSQRLWSLAKARAKLHFFNTTCSLSYLYSWYTKSLSMTAFWRIGLVSSLSRLHLKHRPASCPSLTSPFSRRRSSRGESLKNQRGFW